MSPKYSCVVAPLLSLALLPTLAEADTYVHATGRFVVWDNGAWQPLRNARIQLKDSDFDTDDTIVQGSTDDNGYYSLEGYGGDSGSSSIKKPDIYVNLDARYQRVIGSLQAALAAPTTGDFPDGILSDSFSSSVAAAR